MSKKIYVGNLSYAAGEDDVRQLFEKFGKIESVKIIMDTMTGRPKGFGFVEMNSDEEAGKAIATLNGTSFMERTLNVSEARPQTARGKDAGRSRTGQSSGRRGSGGWR
jgi:RNA recognition motif-containing protein